MGLPLLLFVLACASAPVVPPAPPGQLRVANSTPGPADVFVDGYLLAVAPPSTVRTLPPLPQGTLTVQVVARDGGARVSRRVVLEPGRDVLVELSLGTPGTPPAPLPGVGGLEVVNPHAATLTLVQDGEPLGTVFEHGTRRFDDLVAGPHVLLALGADGVVLSRVDVRIEPGQLTRLELAVPTGDLLLANGLDEDLSVTVAGRPAGTAAPGASLRVADLLAGRLEVEATGLKSFRRHRVQVVLHEDEIRTVSLAGEPGTVRVRNGSREEVEVRLDGRLVTTLPSGHVTRLDDVAPGVHRVEATGRTTSTLYATDVTLAQGESLDWQIDARYGLVSLQNDSAERQRVSLDGLEAAVLEPFRTVELVTVRAGRHAVEATGQKGGHTLRGSLEASPSARAVFVVPSSGLRLSLENTLDEPVRVYRDATWLTEIEAGAVRVLDDVPGGAFLLEAAGQRTERVVRRRVEGKPGSTLVWILRVEQGSVVVKNGSGERLKPSPELAAQHGDLAPGETARFDLPPGRHRLVLSGAVSGLSYAHAVDLRAGDVDVWDLPRPLGTVQVFNRTPEAARLQLAKDEAGTVPPGGSVVLKDVPAGRLELVAQLATSGQVLRHAPFLQPGGLAHWELEREYARVLVENDLDEAVGLEIDGLLWTKLAAGEARLLDKVAPGRHRFVGRGVKSDVRVEAELDVSASRDTRWTVEGARGVAMITNHTAEPLAIELGGRSVGTVGVGAVRRFSGDAGKTRLIVRGLQSQHVWRQWAMLQAGRTFDVDVRSLEARFRVTNRLAVPATVAFAGRRLDQVAPGATLEFAMPCPHAKVELTATTADRTTHARTSACRTNEIHEWVIE
jgi:hypothetical protein